jgi:Carbohydrate esterase, sialic acid-specific acetylesterase
MESAGVLVALRAEPQVFENGTSLMKPLHMMVGICTALLLSLSVYEYDTRRHLDNLINDLKSGANQQASALNASKAELQQSLKGLDNSLDDLRARQLTIERMMVGLQDAMSVLAFSLGQKSDPRSIILGDLDTYESLDANWKSFRDVSGRAAMPCSVAGRTAVIIILGQSNSANHGLARTTSKHAVDNFNLYDGRCYHATDPLLGASGDGGNFATRLGDLLIEEGPFDHVIIAPIGMGGTRVDQWAKEGMFSRRIAALIRRLYEAGLSPNFILWHQGEGESGVGDIEGRQYRKNLLEVVQTFRQYGIGAPFFVALATRCGGGHPNAKNIRDGQRSTANGVLGIYLGPDTDALGSEYRDPQGCHFTEQGLVAHAGLWARAIMTYEASRGPVAGPLSR